MMTSKTFFNFLNSGHKNELSIQITIINQADRDDITVILLKVALNPINPNPDLLFILFYMNKYKQY